jgi:acetyl-CoA carboxylase/biotin carboxylase 1
MRRDVIRTMKPMVRMRNNHELTRHHRGHASENPRLPELLAASPKKVIFIGPPASAMRALGDKISSTIVAQHAKVPCIPWSGSGIDQVTVNEEGIVTVDDEVYKKGCVHSWHEGLEKAKGIGFPVMIKASEGGGGKGIRRADQEEGFETLYNAVASEIPGSPIFIMKLAGNARHLEVQLLADQYGNNISLFGRDCSVQRRHQKIIEEAPVTVARPETFQAMERAAVQLGRLVGYVSAGTVEYLYSHTKDEFYFLELNPRLQVEHPTTEMVSGVNLPAAQLQIAMGLPMHRIRDIRQLYSVDRDAASEIEFISQTQQPKPRGHTTACRITSEDPREGFKPSSGMIHDLNFRSSSNVWGYFSVSNNSSIHNFSDSQFGHIFAYGESRSASRKHMIMALKELSIRGDFQTTTEYLIKLLETPAFIDNAISTGWLDELITRKQVDRIDPILAAVCGAVCQAHLASEACISKYRASLEKGHVPARDALKTLFPIDFIYDSHHYTFTATRSSLSSYNLSINDSKCSVGVRALSDTGLLVLLGGQSHSVYWKEDAGAMRLSIDNKTCLIEQQNDPTQLRTPSPGKLVRYTVENKGHIKAGKAFAEIEVMKMYMPLLAQEDGTVQFIKQPGTALNAGDVLGILTLDDPLRVKQAQPFGHLPDLGLPQVVGSKLIQQFTHLHGILKNTLDGFNNQFIMESAFRELTSVLSNPELPFSEWSAEFSALYSRIPQRLIARLMQIIDRARARKSEFPAKTLAKALQKFMDRSIAAGESLLLESTLAPLIKIVKRYREGLIAHKFHVLSGLLEKYTTVEREFSNPIVSDEEVILRLRDANKDDIFKAIQVILSHNNISAKNDLILVILGEYKLSNLNAGNVAAKLFRPALQQLAELESRETATVSLKARQVLIQCALPSVEERAVQLEYILQYSVLEPQYSEMEREHRKPDLGVLRDVVDSSCAIFDVLPILFSHQDPWISLAALEVYVRCAYRTYSLENIQYHNESNDSLCIVSWDFVLRTVAASEPDIETASQLVTPSMPVASTTTSFENGNPLKRMRFICDRSNLIKCPDKEPIRKGVIVPVQYLEEVEEHLVRALEVLPSIAEWNKSCNGTTPDLASTQKSSILELLGSEELLAVCNAVISDAESLDDNKMLLFIQRIVEQNKDQLLFRRVRQLTFICIHKNKGHPGYYTFHGPKYEEDQTIRHCDPALAFQLELERLSNFNIKPAFTKNHTIHIFEAVNKEVQSDKRYFARAVVQHGQMRDEILTVEYFISESSRLIHDILDVLDVLESNCDLNHIFINFSPVFPLQPFEIKKALSGVLEVFRCRLWRLRVTDVEIHIFCTDPLTNIAYPLRVIVSNTSGYVFRVEMYTERMSENGKWLFQSIGNTDIGAFHLLPISTPYPTKNWLQPKRYKAHLMGTQYAYDFPALFEEAVQKSWTKAVRQYPPFAKMQPSTCIDYRELVLDAQDNLFEVIREPGMNTQGIVAWIATARTPEYPHGRRFIIIANDVTFRIGSFGLQEDEFFYKCTEYARNLGIPRIYISANSGARIGMAEELIPYFSVAWNNPKNPEAGFKYLYLTPEVKKRFDDDGTTQDVITEEVTEDGETRHKITMIVGAKDGHGMECLRGSGLIAAVTSRAYEDIFTITLVTCRSVGRLFLLFSLFYFL